MKHLSLLIKPASSNCNIDCRYCFYKEEDKLREKGCLGFMTLDTLEVMVKRVFECATEKVSFVFQGGEPTLMGLDFYKNFIQFVHKYNVNNIVTDYNIQTNGILIDKEWCVFLKENHFLVGLSFDGMPKVNDLYRVTYHGGGTSEKILKAIRLMQKMDVDYNVLMVVTHQGAKEIKACYEFCQKIGVEYLQIIPALDPYGEGKESHDYSLRVQDLEQCLCDLFDTWYQDFINQREVRITYFENIIYKLMGNPFTMCSMNGMCAIESVVEADGSFYPCDFYVSDEWCLGNLHDQGIDEMVLSKKASRFIADSVNLNTRCKNCGFYGLCLGACKRYQLGHQGVYENYYCPAYKHFFAYCGQRMIQIAQALSKQKNP